MEALLLISDDKYIPSCYNTPALSNIKFDVSALLVPNVKCPVNVTNRPRADQCSCRDDDMPKIFKSINHVS